MGHIAIDVDALKALDQAMPVVMLNLLRYKTEADFPENSGQMPCCGREAYQRYSAAAGPLAEKANAKLRFMGSAAANLIKVDGEHWDDVLIVEYPSVQVLLNFIGGEEYAAVSYLRTAALEDSRLIAMSELV